MRPYQDLRRRVVAGVGLGQLVSAGNLPRCASDCARAAQWCMAGADCGGMSAGEWFAACLSDNCGTVVKAGAQIRPVQTPRMPQAQNLNAFASSCPPDRPYRCSGQCCAVAGSFLTGRPCSDCVSARVSGALNVSPSGGNFFQGNAAFGLAGPTMGRDGFWYAQDSLGGSVRWNGSSWCRA